MPVWTIVILALMPNAPDTPHPALIQRHFAAVGACERAAARVEMPAPLRLVCVPSEGELGSALAAAY